MFRQAMRLVFGKSLANERLADEKFNVFWGMPILSSDAISSVAYAVDEMLWILVPVIGFASYLWMPKIAISIILLLLILIFSYRSVVDAYPNGGGAYVVAKENLKPLYGLIAGASLSVDYVLTVAVSVSAGTAAVTSAFPQFYPHRVLISVVIIFLLLVGNIRGIRESSRIFSIPTYAFIAAIIALIIVGITKYTSGSFSHIPNQQLSHVPFGTEAVTIFLLLKAFSSGCSALTGVEAVSNAVPNFKEPAAHNAKLAYAMLAGAVLISFGGIAYLAKIYHAVPTPKLTVMAQISIDVFGQGGMFYFIQAATAVILALAANTAFAGFPTLLSVIAQDGYAPRQLKMRGHRLNFNNGIIVLAVLATILVMVFKSDTHLLIPLYAVGVFTSFTLSQYGMLVRWFKLKPDKWKHKAVINGLGAITTFIAVIIIGVTKFTQGAWVVVLIIPLIVTVMFSIKRHYISVAEQLDIPNDVLDSLELNTRRNHYVIVPIDSFNAMVVKTLRYARSISPNVVAFHVEIFDGEADKLRNKWARLHTDIELVIKVSEFRDVLGPLVKFIDSEEHQSREGDIITILLPQFFVSKWWQMILHNNTSIFIAGAMFNKHNVVVSIMPFYIEDMHLDKKPIKSEDQPLPIENPELKQDE